MLEIAAADSSTCALLEGGELKCWGSLPRGLRTAPATMPASGSTAYDAVGDAPGEMGDALPAIDVGEHPVRKLVPSLYGLCFVSEAETLECWGQNNTGQLGQGHTEESEPGSSPVSIDLGIDVTLGAVFGGSYGYCATLSSTNAEGSVKCWGGNASGQLALGDTENRGDAPGEMSDALPFAKLGTGTLTQLALGGGHACGLFSDQRLKCWGSLTQGDAGNAIRFGATEDTIGSRIPALDFGTFSAEGRVPVQVVSGTWFACARFDDAEFACWGRWQPRITMR